MEEKERIGSGSNVKALVLAALFIALSFIGANIKIFGTIAFDSLPGFLSTLILGPAYGAAIGFIGHMFTALTSGFPMSLPMHLVIAVSMAVTMFGFGASFNILKKRASKIINFSVTWIVGVVLNGPVSLALSIGTMTLMSGTEAGLGLLAMLPVLVAGAAVNVSLCLILFTPLELVWKKMS